MEKYNSYDYDYCPECGNLNLECECTEDEQDDIDFKFEYAFESVTEGKQSLFKVHKPMR